MKEDRDSKYDVGSSDLTMIIQNIASDVMIAIVTSSASGIGLHNMPDFCRGLVEASAAALAHYTSPQTAHDTLLALAATIRPATSAKAFLPN